MPICQVSTAAKVKGVADVVFAFDCTGSMSPYIENVKNNVASLITGFNATPNVTLDWRVRAMGYLDFTYDEKHLYNDFDFTNDADNFVNNQLTRLEIGNGGDAKESTLDAIWYALKKSNWRENCTKVIVVFTDNGTKDVHESTMDELGVVGDVAYLQQELMKNRVQLFMYCGKDAAYDELQTTPRSHIYQYDNPGEQLLTTDFAELLKIIGKTVSASIITEKATL